MDSPTSNESSPLWTPSVQRVQSTNLYAFLQWLKERGQSVANYAALWKWSVTDQTEFWLAVWEYFDIHSSTPYHAVLEGAQMPDFQWFPGARLNYAEHIFRQSRGGKAAIFFRNEAGLQEEWTWDTLEAQVGALAQTLRNLGVGPGDRVASYLPNIPQTVAAFLATASLGAIWSSCSPDFGPSSILDRIGQIRPKVLFAVDGYRYNGEIYDRRETVTQVVRALPDLMATIFAPYVFPDEEAPDISPLLTWQQAVSRPAPLTFAQVPFEAPLWILYSSGTTGMPKAIVHGHGGMLLQHLVNATFHIDLSPDDRFFWFTTTGWMMWNIVVSGLLTGSAIILYDGHPAFPDFNRLWQLAEESQMTVFGTSAAYLHGCMKARIQPGRDFNLQALQSIGSTGSPLMPEAFLWVYAAVKDDVCLSSSSGGTDVCSAFVAGVPTLPVFAGEIQARALGVAVEAYDEAGVPVVDQVGELVITMPMPAMPVAFWNDPDGSRYRASYFDAYPGVWRHGDWIRITPRGSVIIYGRSDSTINRYGIRMGSSEIYRIVEVIAEVQDSLVVDLEALGQQSYMPLFVQMKPGCALTEEVQNSIRGALRDQLSPRHVPDAIIAVEEIPKTLSGKKLEIPVKKILMGIPASSSVNQGAMQNPCSLSPFIALAAILNRPRPGDGQP